AADHGRRPVPRHGPLRDQRHRQLDRDLGGGELGGRARSAGRAPRPRRARSGRGGLTSAPMRTRLAPVVALVIAAMAASAFAQDEEEGTSARALAGTLRKARDSGVVMLGYRDNAFPFSYLAKDGVPIGYSLELCRDIVEDMATAVDRPLAIRYVAVTPETRMSMLTSGRIDLECGSTTANTERRKVVAFSPVTFVAGTKLLVRRDSGIRSI